MDPLPPRTRPDEDPLMRGALIAFALLYLGLGLWMVIAPGSFFDQVGPFGARNDHYIRDTATWELTLALALVMALTRPRWRVVVFAFVFVQSTLHAINHLVDIGTAHRESAGVFDFVVLVVVAAVAGWMLRRASLADRASGRGMF